ncbi:MAG: nuclear transport factor 2 family protein, partial [Bacteroidota bacterium]
MTRSLTLALCLLVTGLAAPTAAAQSADLDAVRVPLELYLQGQAEGDGDFMRQAFHPDATVSWMRDGEVAQRTAEEFAALFTRGPAGDEADRQRRIVSIDVTGDVAVARLELDYPGAFITDYMTLLRVDGEWRIIHKAYTRSAPRVR